jgi:hypothetical protein
MQWTTVRLVVSENDGRCYQSEIKLTGERRRISASRRNKLLGLEEDRMLKQWG